MKLLMTLFLIALIPNGKEFIYDKWSVPVISILKL